MMDVVKEKIEKPDNSIKLGSLNGGNCFYFASMSFEQALKEDAIYHVISGGKENRVQIANMKDGLTLMRDDCHLVVELKTKLVVID